MLVHLSIRDIVLIDRLDLDFRDGLGVLTGETGAGKSILLDALGLVLGARAETRLIRKGAERAQVTAEFDLPADHAVHAVLADAEIEGEGPLIIRRVVGADGRSRAFLQDQPVGTGLLRELAPLLVEIHGQFQNQGLLDPSNHRAALDRFAGLTGEVSALGEFWEARRQAAAERDRLAEQAEAARAQESWLTHAAAEIAELGPQPGEEQALEQRRAMLMGRERLLEALQTALDALTEQAAAGLGTALRALERAQALAGEQLSPTLEVLAGTDAEVQEAAASLRRLALDLSEDEGSADQVEERLFALRALARKHQVSVDALPGLADDLAGNLRLIESGDVALAEAMQRAEAAHAAWLSAAKALSAGRARAAAELDRAIAHELAPLKLGHARVVTRVEQLPAERAGPHGLDQVTFAVATQPGAEPGPLGKIASGGELARFMLALRVVLAGAAADGGRGPATLIFDEVDAGIGGAVADAVGERLARLGEARQVLVVTHSPQVAARGRWHLQVTKQLSAESALTRVAELAQAERREEIARMLSGAEISEEARAAAQRLMDAAA